MSKLVDDGIVTDELLAWFTAQLTPFGILVGDADSPAASTDDVAHPKFLEVRQLPDGEMPSGGWTQPLMVRGLKYQLRAVGENRRQAQWVAQRAREKLFEYASPQGTGYATPITLAKHAVVRREAVSDLGYVASGRSGGYLFHIRLRVQRTQD